MELKVIPAFEVATIWPKAKGFLVQAMGVTSPIGYSASDIFDFLECGEFVLAVIMDAGDVYAALCLQIVTYPSLKRCRVRLIGGGENHPLPYSLPPLHAL